LKEKLKLLLELQNCDSRINELLRKRSEGPKRIQGLKQELEEIDKQNREAEGRLESLKKERRQMEREVQELEGKVQKSEIKLSNIKSNKEYTAGLKEIEDLKSMKFSLEDKVINFMEEIEALEKDLQTKKKRKAEATIETEKAILSVEEQMKELGSKLESLQRQRPSIAEKIEKGLLKSYTVLMERKGGQAVSAVVRGVCQACHIGLPPQKFNDLLKGDEILTCPHCNRIIYWGEDLEFQAEERVE
jgi:predicted  nucleic acid-binding Zn-ribbon protein